MNENYLIARLAQGHGEFLRACLKPIQFDHGDVLADAGEPIDKIVFPRTGMISIVVELRDGARIEAAMVGRDGAVGLAALFGTTTHLSTAYAQVPGTAWNVRPADLLSLVTSDRALRPLFFAQEQFILAQAQQTAACNAKHHIPHRLAAWLLRAYDLTGSRELQLTQEYLAQMLGVQRASVSVFASGLQDRGLIRYSRGRVTIVNPQGLQEMACECASALRRQHAMLFAGESLSRQAEMA